MIFNFLLIIYYNIIIFLLEISTTKTEIISKSDDKKTNYEWLFNLQLWCLYISSGLTYFILKGISDWIGLYVVEHYHWTTSTSTILLFWSEVFLIFCHK